MKELGRIVVSKRNGETAKVLLEKSNEVVLLLSDGSKSSIKPATLSRWWVDQNPETVDEVVEEVPVAEEILIESDMEKPKKVTKKKSEKKPKNPAKGNPETVGELFGALKSVTDEYDIVIVPTNSKNFYMLKYEGKMVGAFTKTSKAITLWVKSKVIKDDIPESKYELKNHLFDARLKFGYADNEMVNLVTKSLLLARADLIEKLNSRK